MRALLVLLALSSSASAENPHGWIVRAAPGLGYSWDEARTCAVQGRMFVGGFSAAYEVKGGMFVGAATTIVFNQLLADGPCGLEDGIRIAMGIVVGPAIEVYPDPEESLSLFALAGYTTIDHGDTAMEPGRGS